MSSFLITGGAGFIGSHLADRLLSDSHRVVSIDDLSLGTMSNIEKNLGRADFRFVRGNILEATSLDESFAGEQFDAVIHLAANSDIQKSSSDPSIDLDKTFGTTVKLLDKMREKKAKRLIFASSSAIYGERDTLLSEASGPLLPVSMYGAAKLSSEAFISAFANIDGMHAWIFRFPNVVGERSTHGVMFDFISRLRLDAGELRILGDGKQRKPYLYIHDLIDGILFAYQKAPASEDERVQLFNLGTRETTTVTRIAEIIVEEMGLSDVRFSYSGGSYGWPGDVPFFQYDLRKMESLGWSPQYSSDEAVRVAVRAFLAEPSA